MGVVCKYLLGHVGGIIALLGVIVLPITSGDTALRALRLSPVSYTHLDVYKRQILRLSAKNGIIFGEQKKTIVNGQKNGLQKLPVF